MKKLIFILILAFSILHFQLSIAVATVLSDAAAKLSAGQWAQVSGMTNLNLTANPGYDPLASAPGPGYDGTQPAWDAATGKLYIEATEHGRASQCPESWPNSPNWCWKKLWTYDDATNTWAIDGPFPNISGNPVAGVHTWGMIAWDAVNKVLYVKKFDYGPTYSMELFRYCAANSAASYCASQLGQWNRMTGYNPPSNSSFGQLGWHPTLNGGTLLVYDGAGNPSTGCGALFGYSEGSGWRIIDAGTGCKFPAGSLTSLPAARSTAKGVVIFGPTGSSNLQWWKIDGAGTISTLDTAPCAFYASDYGFGQAIEDPTGTGDIIFIGCTNAGQMWRLNPTGSPGSQWSLIDGDLSTAGKICNVQRNPGAPNVNCGFDFFPTPISTYGVIGFWKFRAAGSSSFAEYWIYKPSTFVADTTPPTGVAVTAPSGGATISGTSVTLSATASDNVGVAGVQFKVDGGNVSVEDTAAPFSITWDSTTVSNGAHTITATARDAAGNTTTSSGVSVTVSNVAGGGADFATRCKGAFFCNGFDSAADLGGDGWGNARGHAPSDGTQFCGANNCPTIDTATKISGAGAMKFTIPPGGTGTDAGGYWANPSTDFSVRFGAGQTWYIQFRQRVTASYAGAAANNNKIHWVSSRPDLPGCTVSTSSQGNCFATCTENEIVNQNQYPNPSNAFPRWYTACPGPNNFEFITPVTPGQYNLENGRTAPGCLYDNVSAGNIFPPNGNCFPFSFDQWVTWSYKITLGSIGTGAKGGQCYDANIPSIPTNKQNCYYGGQFQVRAGLDGQPLTTVVNWTGPMVAVDGRLTPDGTQFVDPTELKYGKVFFAPYTGVGSVLPNGATMWVDELIMSTSPIADPGAGGGTVAAPTTIRLSGGY